MRFSGSISLGPRVLATVAGDMNGISGTQGGYFGDFAPDRGESPAFDADTLYRLDVDDGPSIAVHVMNSPGPGSSHGEAGFRSRGNPVGLARGSRSGHPADTAAAGCSRPERIVLGRPAGYANCG